MSSASTQQAAELLQTWLQTCKGLVFWSRGQK